MLHVALQPEPADFDARVRQKGLAHLEEKRIALDKPLPEKTRINAYWKHCLDDLYVKYDSTCAYLGTRFEQVHGCGSVDHFAPKSLLPAQAYEWSNYRLVCSRMNSRKREFQDVLDPFFIENGYFHLELVSGRIYANPNLDASILEQVKATITRLKLDDAICRNHRASLFNDYVVGEFTANHLKKQSPFVWYEADRQGIL